MNITWKDGVTTLATAGAVALQQAHVNAWNWPLVDSIRWTIIGILLLTMVTFIFGFLLDTQKGASWQAWAASLAVIIAGLAAFGLIDPISDYLNALIWTSVIFWFSALAWHALEPADWRTRHV